MTTQFAPAGQVSRASTRQWQSTVTPYPHRLNARDAIPDPEEPMKTLLKLALALILATPLSAKQDDKAKPSGKSRPATLLLITDQSLAEAWAPFAEWKTRLGK
jgi:hypothetical protein